jgi:lipid-A-disaccharide synthase
MARKNRFRLLVSSGEPSGDLIAGQVVEKLRSLEPAALTFGMGGPRMASAGCEILRPLPSVMGLGSPFKNAGALAGSIMDLSVQARKRKVEAALLVDFPDFHMPLAWILHKLGIPVFQFVSPQIWAWRSGRIKSIRNRYEKTFLIFPFEKEIYDRAGAPSEFVGHPAVDRLKDFPDRAAARQELGIIEGETVVALLPGSRKAVFEKNNPVFLASARVLSSLHPHLKFLLSAPDLHLKSAMSEQYGGMNFTISGKPGPLLLRAADAAIVSSGTAALESVILGTPFAGVYVTSEITYRVVKRFISVNHILMANILSGRDIVREFIQDEAMPEAIAGEICSLLVDDGKREKMKADFIGIASMLGPFDAAGRVASSLIDFSRNNV